MSALFQTLFNVLFACSEMKLTLHSLNKWSHIKSSNQMTKILKDGHIRLTVSSVVLVSSLILLLTDHYFSNFKLPPAKASTTNIYRGSFCPGTHSQTSFTTKEGKRNPLFLGLVNHSSYVRWKTMQTTTSFLHINRFHKRYINIFFKNSWEKDLICCDLPTLSPPNCLSLING